MTIDSFSRAQAANFDLQMEINGLREQLGPNGAAEAERNKVLLIKARQAIGKLKVTKWS